MVDDKLISKIKGMHINAPINIKKISKVEKTLEVNFPEDYKEFLLKCNGAEGKIGKYSYLDLWNIDQVLDMNSEESVKKYTPNFLYIGSDGSELIYAFDYKSVMGFSVVQMPFESTDIKDAQICALTFNEFVLNRF